MCIIHYDCYFDLKTINFKQTQNEIQKERKKEEEKKRRENNNNVCTMHFLFIGIQRQYLKRSNTEQWQALIT